MSKPVEKSAEMNDFLDGLSTDLFGSSRSDSISSNTCVICRRPASEFRDESSTREFQISGMCQDCQDETFGV